jgi:hypothetical protein
MQLGISLGNKRVSSSSLVSNGVFTFLWLVTFSLVKAKWHNPGTLSQRAYANIEK